MRDETHHKNLRFHRKPLLLNSKEQFFFQSLNLIQNINHLQFSIVDLKNFQHTIMNVAARSLAYKMKFFDLFTCPPVSGKPRTSAWPK